MAEPNAAPSGWGASAARALRAAGRAFRVSSTVVGAGVLVGSGLAAVVAHDVRKKQLALPEEFVLDLDLRHTELVEAVAPPFKRFGGPSQVTVCDLVSVMEEAGKDVRVKGVLATLPDTMGKGLGGIAQVQEVCSAVSRFRLVAAERQVPCVAYAHSFGSTQAYYLATAFGEIYMQPTGIFLCTGVASQVPFFRGLLDKWKIVPLSHAREEYKNATNPITKTGSTRAHREATSKLVQGLSGQIFEAVAAGRGLSLRAVRAAVDGAPIMAPEAAQRGLVTASKYADEVEEMVTTSAEGRSPLRPLKKISYKRFLKAVKLKKEEERRQKKKSRKNTEEDAVVVADGSGDLSKEGEAAPAESDGDVGEPPAERKKLSHREEWLSHWKQEGVSAWWEAMTRSLAGDLGPREVSPFPLPPPTPKVALVYALGPIVSTKSKGSDEIDAMKICQHLAKLREDKAVAAVVVRVDSPGGSATASDSIHREVSLLRAAGKKVVISMGNVAASGGYYIACAADSIVAAPGTITGSIGVTTLKLDASGFLEEQGIRVETVKAGKNADALSVAGGYTAEQDRILNRLMDGIYKDFVSKVAEGRGMTYSAAKRLAKGRIYTGAEAKKLGLVDELGGLNDAMKIARDLAKLPEDAAVDTWPSKPSPLEALRQAASGDMAAVEAIAGSWAIGAADSAILSMMSSVFGSAATDAATGRLQGPQARADAAVEGVF